MKTGILTFAWIASVLVTGALLHYYEATHKTDLTCKVVDVEPSIVEECSNSSYKIIITKQRY